MCANRAFILIGPGGSAKRGDASGILRLGCRSLGRRRALRLRSFLRLSIAKGCGSAFGCRSNKVRILPANRRPWESGMIRWRMDFGRSRSRAGTWDIPRNVECDIPWGRGSQKDSADAIGGRAKGRAGSDSFEQVGRRIFLKATIGIPEYIRQSGQPSAAKAAASGRGWRHG